MPECLKVNTMKFFFAVTSALLLAASGSAQDGVHNRPSVVLESPSAKLVIDIAGGSIVRFLLPDQGLNPLVWREGEPGMEPRAMGHFLCLDRWGAPSDAELANGIPFHGEAPYVQWNVVKQPRTAGEAVEAEMSASLPLAGLDVQRRLRLLNRSAVAVIEETVTNRNKIGRIYNWVQHPTIGPPFLDATVVVDANAREGFMQDSPLPNPEGPSVYWPQALKEGQPVNMRRLTDDPLPQVVSYTIDQKIGWTTAANASKGLMLGYLWKTEQYPWFNAWRHVDEGKKPLARGLEFGTTGLHQPFAVLVSKGRIFGRPLFAHIDTGQSVTKSYVMFLVKIPAGFMGVSDVSYVGNKIVIREHDSERSFKIDAPGLPFE